MRRFIIVSSSSQPQAGCWLATGWTRHYPLPETGHDLVETSDFQINYYNTVPTEVGARDRSSRHQGSNYLYQEQGSRKAS